MKMCRLTQEVGKQIREGQMRKCGQSTNVGELRSKTRCETNTRRRIE
jgi:hypothetical protein